LLVALHQVELLAAAVEPVARTEIRARQLGEPEHVSVEGERGVGVADADGYVMDAGRLHTPEGYAGSVPAAQDDDAEQEWMWARSTAR
jgi:hypothetical protein